MAYIAAVSGVHVTRTLEVVVTTMRAELARSDGVVGAGMTRQALAFVAPGAEVAT